MIFNQSFRLTSAFCALISLSLLSLFPVNAQSTVTAEFPVSSNTAGLGSFTSGQFRVAQTFTTTRAGTLETVSVAMAPQNASSIPSQIAVEFRETVAGSPSSAILAEAFIDGSLLSGATLTNPFMLDADFLSADIFLEAGSVYAFSLRAVGSGSPFVSGSGAFLADTYEDGDYFYSEEFGLSWTEQMPPSDINFRVTVIPEPSVFGLFALGVFGLLFHRRLKAKKK